MTHRERMLAAIKGDSIDRIPWAPRMDLWCIALRTRGTMPQRFVGLDTAQIADQLDVACHAVRADFTLPREPAELALRGLGIDNHPDYPFRVELRDLPMQFDFDGECYQTTIQAPGGEVTMRLRMTKQMAIDGISLPFVEKYPIASMDDLEPVAQVFEHLEVIPTPQAYAVFHQRIGDRGLAVGHGAATASPMHLLLHDLMEMEEFYIYYIEQRDELEQFAKRLDPFFQAMLNAVTACSAETILWGANYDRDLTWPPFFQDQIAPWLTHASKRMHDAGQLLITHPDGENQKLMSLYQDCNFDVAESVCPAPMTHHTLRELQKGMGPNITIWGGIPSVAVMNDAMDDRTFESYMDKLFSEIDSEAGLILGVSDNVPPVANMDRLESVKQRIEAFGPVNPRKQ